MEKHTKKKGCLLFALQNSRTLRYSWTNNCGRSAAKYAATFGPSTLTHQTHTHTHACMECHENRWRRESQINEFIKTKKITHFLHLFRLSPFHKLKPKTNKNNNNNKL